MQDAAAAAAAALARVVGVSQPMFMTHKQWNKLMHITHGNTIELVSMNMAGAVILLQGAAVDATGKGAAKLESLEAFLTMRRRPAFLALQECAGGWGGRNAGACRPPPPAGI